MFRSKASVDLKAKLEAYKNKKAKSHENKDDYSKTTDGKKYLLANWLIEKMRAQKEVSDAKKALFVAHTMNEKIENEKNDPTADMFLDKVTYEAYTMDQLCDKMFNSIMVLPPSLEVTKTGFLTRSDLSKYIAGLFNLTDSQANLKTDDSLTAPLVL